MINNTISMNIKEKGLDITIAGTASDSDLIKMPPLSPQFLLAKLQATTEYGEYIKDFSVAGLMRIRELLRAICTTHTPTFLVNRIDLVWSNGPDTITLS